MAIKIQGVDVIDDNKTLKNVTNADNIIQQPINITPANGAVFVQPQEDNNFDFILNDYKALFDDLAGIQLQVSVDENFSNVILDTTSSNTLISTIKTPANTLVIDTNYYWRARYFDSRSIFSNYSDPTEFTTANSFIVISKPTITSPETGNTGLYYGVTLISSAFNVAVGSIAHESTDWQIGNVANFANIQYESLGDTSNLTTISVPDDALFANSTFYIRARYNGTANVVSSQYSDTVEYSTQQLFDANNLVLAGGNFTTYDANTDLINTDVNNELNYSQDIATIPNPNGDPFQIKFNMSTVTGQYIYNTVGGTNTIHTHRHNIQLIINGTGVQNQGYLYGGFDEPYADGATLTNVQFDVVQNSPPAGDIIVRLNGSTTQDSRSGGTALIAVDATFDEFEILPIV